MQSRSFPLPMTLEDKLAFGERHLLVNEIFGPTIQGEGRSLGTPCIFLRLSHCNLHCTKCDTYYAWDWNRVNIRDESHKMTLTQVKDAIFSLVDGTEIHHLVISGGEPMLQQRGIIELIRLIRDISLIWTFEIETAGTISPEWALIDVADFNVSPKLAHTGNELLLRYRPEVLKRFIVNTEAVFKFWVQGPADIHEINHLCDAQPIMMPHNRVYLMPEGIDAEQIKMGTKDLIELAVKYGYNVTTRLHITLFGNKRGI